MGLCKCPQRKVSNLFCFKHHVNVCEFCLVNEHPQCVVKSYVAWLQDQDYNPNCILCQRSLIDTGEETIRLVCYDLFHWNCLNEYFRLLPAHTAPDGYTCPTCHSCVFPPINLVSPVADRVREKLATASWATRLPALSSSIDSTTTNQEKATTTSLTVTENNGYVIVNPTGASSGGGGGGSGGGGGGGLSHHPHRTLDMTQGATTLSSRSLPPFDSDDEDKYKRRSVFTWFARWLRSRQTTTNRKSINRIPLSRTRFTCYMILLIIFIFLTLLTVLYHLTRGGDNGDLSDMNNDPQFDPFNNPFIRVGGRYLKKKLKEESSPIAHVPIANQP